MTPVRRRLSRTALLSGTALAALVGSAVPTLAQVTTSFTVGGQVIAPRTFTLSDLQALTPVVTENVSFLSGASSTTTTFTGVSMFNLLNNVVGLKTTPGVPQDQLRNVVIATGSDGYSQVYAWGEINPMFGGNASAFNGAAVAGPELIAYANNPGQLLGSDGFARTTEPGDQRGGRYVSNLQTLSVLHAPRMTGTFAGGVSSSFTLTGQVNNPTTFTAASLALMPTVTTVTPVTPSGVPLLTLFTGVPLWDILQSAGVITNPAVSNNLERMFVIATGSDGFQATVAVGEIDPRFGAHTTNPIIVAYAANGEPLVGSGATRLITPDDNAHGRWVSNLVNLELFDVSNWKILAGESLDLNAFNYQTLGFTLAGGTLTSAAGAATLTAPTYTFNGGVIDTNITLGGTGTTTQASGTTSLFGTIATPNVAISGGTLKLENNQRLSNVTTLVMTSGTFDLNGFSQTIASLNGTGTVALSSAVAGGQLAVGSGTFGGTIVNGGSQAGSLVKQGAGTLTLTGTNTYTGTTQVNGGTFLVNGSIASSSGLTVNAGGLIGGTGTLPTTTINGGTLSPGNSIGTLTIQGNLALTSAAAYLVEVSPSTADRTNVTGTASLNGTVQASFATGNYAGRNYTILSATGGRTGTFSGLSTNLAPGFAASLSYTATDVVLGLSAILGANTTLSTNERNVATSLNSYFNAGGTLTPNFTSLFSLTGTNLAAALSLLSGEVATGAQQGAFQLSGQFLRNMLDPFASGRGGPASGGASAFAPERFVLPDDVALAYAKAMKAPVYKAAPAPVFEPRWTMWGAAYGGYNQTDGNPAVGARDLTSRTGGFAAGADYRVAPGTTVGFALAGGGTRWELAQGLGTGKSDAFQAGVYGITRTGQAYIGASLAFTNYWMSTDRIAFAGNRLTADFDAESFGGRIEGGYRFGTTASAVTPYAAVQAQSFHTPTYAETDVNGGGFGLTVNSRNATATRSELGARFDHVVALNNGTPLTFRGKLAWAHDWVSDPTVSAAFQGLPGAAFIVNGATPARDLALASIGSELRLSDRATIGVKFDGEFSGRSQTYAGTGTLRVNW